MTTMPLKKKQKVKTKSKDQTLFNLATESNPHITIRTHKNEYLKQNPSHGTLLAEKEEVEDVHFGGEATIV